MTIFSKTIVLLASASILPFVGINAQAQVAIGTAVICSEGQKVVGLECVPEVYFHKTYLPFENMQKEAAIMARERGWVLANTQDIQTAWESFALDVPFLGLLQDGMAIPVQKDTPSAGVSRGVNINVNVRHPDGFFYVKETATNRVQELPVQFVAPDWWPKSPLSTASGGGLPGSTWRDVPSPTYAGMWSNRQSDQHPAKALFGLGDARLMRDAARQQLKKYGKPATASAIDAHLQTLRSDPVARYKFSPFLLGAAFEALSTPNPDATQAAFRKVFELYMSYEKYRVSGVTYQRWREFNGQNPYTPKPGYGYGVSAANFLPQFPSTDNFMGQNENPMQIGSEGLKAIQMLMDPATMAALPEFKNNNYAQIGADFAAIAVAAGIGGTFGTAAGTITVVGTAVFGPSITISMSTTAATAAGLVGTATPYAGIVTVQATPGLLISKNILAVGSSSSLSGSAAIGVIVAVALAALIGKTAADMAKSDALDRELRHNLDVGPQPVDIYSLVNSSDEGTRSSQRTAALSYLMKMLIADPAEKGLLTIKTPTLPAETEPVSGSPAATAISVMSATYGGNCNAPSGNVTAHIANQCNGKNVCDYPVHYTRIGDPVPGCAKDYIVNYSCPDGITRSANAAAEAGVGSVVNLACPSTISVTSATYGGNCKAPSGNVTAHIANQCNGKDACDYPVHYTQIGDPVPGCSKDYMVNYSCSDGSKRSANAPAEAGIGSVVKLNCSQ